MIKAERMKQMDELKMNNTEEDSQFVEWKAELNKELRSFWKEMTE